MWADVREGWEFIFVNPVVRAVVIGLATGLIGGAMLVPLGPTFARYVIGDADKSPPVHHGDGRGRGPRRGGPLDHPEAPAPGDDLPVPGDGGGRVAVVGVSMASFWLAVLGVLGLGLFAGASSCSGSRSCRSTPRRSCGVGSSTTLLTLVRLCVMLALLMGPILATIFNGFARAATGDAEPEVPTASLFGFDLAIPGVRITLWLASAIIFGAGVLAARSMQMGIRESFKSDGTTCAPASSASPVTQGPTS